MDAIQGLRACPQTLDTILDYCCVGTGKLKIQNLTALLKYLPANGVNVKSSLNIVPENHSTPGLPCWYLLHSTMN